MTQTCFVDMHFFLNSKMGVIGDPQGKIWERKKIIDQSIIRFFLGGNHILKIHVKLLVKTISKIHSKGGFRGDTIGGWNSQQKLYGLQFLSVVVC